jgi:hypothetical protein
MSEIVVAPVVSFAALDERTIVVVRSTAFDEVARYAKVSGKADAIDAASKYALWRDNLRSAALKQWLASLKKPTMSLNGRNLDFFVPPVGPTLWDRMPLLRYVLTKDSATVMLVDRNDFVNHDGDLTDGDIVDPREYIDEIIVHSELILLILTDNEVPTMMVDAIRGWVEDQVGAHEAINYPVPRLPSGSSNNDA